MYILALIAETVGLDFRVLVLQRSAQEILASTSRRKFGGQVEAQILIDNAAVLHSQLALIGRPFYFCLHWEQLLRLKAPPLQGLKGQLVDFVHPHNLRGVIIDELLGQVSYSRKQSFDTPFEAGNNSSEILSQLLRGNDEHYHIFQLNRRLDLISSLCALESK